MRVYGTLAVALVCGGCTGSARDGETGVDTGVVEPEGPGAADGMFVPDAVFLVPQLPIVEGQIVAPPGVPPLLRVVLVDRDRWGGWSDDVHRCEVVLDMATGVAGVGGPWDGGLWATWAPGPDAGVPAEVAGCALVDVEAFGQTPTGFVSGRDWSVGFGPLDEATAVQLGDGVSGWDEVAHAAIEGRARVDEPGAAPLVASSHYGLVRGLDPEYGHLGDLIDMTGAGGLVDGYYYASWSTRPWRILEGRVVEDR